MNHTLHRSPIIEVEKRCALVAATPDRYNPPMVPEPRFSRRRSLSYAAVLVVAFFAMAEGILRMVGVSPPVKPRILLRFMDTDIRLPFMKADPDVFWSPQPGWRGEFMGKPVTINNLGVRGPEMAESKPSGWTRIVCFGDSVTFGYGVGDEETYPYQLGRELADRQVEVVNAGVTGYTSHQVRGLAHRLLPRLSADIVTVSIGWNDGNRRPVDDREYERRLRMITAVEGPLDRLYLYRALKRAYVRAVALKGLEREPGTLPEGRRVSLEQYRENLEAIVAESRTLGASPVFIALPRRKRPGEALPDPAHARAFLEIGRALDVPVLDSGELGLTTTLPSNDEYFLDLLHLSPAGNALMARQLARQMLDKGLLGDRRRSPSR